MKKLTILQINDSHSYLEPHPEVFYEASGLEIRNTGGYARIAALAEKFREEANGNLLFLDNGDTFHGTYEAVTSEGESMLPVLNLLGLNAMTFHWDIAYGPKRLLELSEKLTYPILAGNVFEKDTNKLFRQPYIVKEINDLKIGIIGLASNIIDKTMPPKFSEGLYFTMGDQELPRYIQELKDQGADLILLLSHLGYPQDVKILEKVSGIDVCISGHTHNRIDRLENVNGAIIMQSGSHGSFLGKLDLTVNENGIAQAAHELVTVHEDLAESQAMKKVIEAIMEPHREKLDVPVGETAVMLHRGTGLESPMDNLLLKALLNATGAQMAFSNGWRYGVPIRPGSITLRDLYHIIPVNPKVSTVTITGRELWDMLEENLENTYAKEAFDQMGGYVKRAMGIKAYIKIENNKGMRIQKLFAAGEAVQLEKAYQAVFVTEQGVPSKYGTDRKNLEISAIEALKNYLKQETFHLADTGSFVVV